jgi:hypothetical protein
MRTKLLGLAFLAILIINAIALTATASAVEVLLTQFLPEPSAVKPVTFNNLSGLIELVPLKEKLGGAGTIHCEKSKSKGELTTPKLGKVEIEFENCKGAGAACEDLGKKLPKGIITKGPLHIQTAEEKLVKPEQVPAFVVLPEALHFTCGVTLFLILQSKEDPSCVAGRILEPNTLLKELKVLIIEDPEALGDPNIIKVFNDEDKEYKCTLFFNVSEGPLSDGAIHSEEQIKLKEFKQGGKEVTALIDF